MIMEVYAIFPPSRSVEGMLEEPVAIYSDFNKAELQASRLSMKDGMTYLITKYHIKEEVDAPVVKQVFVVGLIEVEDDSSTKNFTIRLLSCKEWKGEEHSFSKDRSSNGINRFHYQYIIDVREDDTIDKIKDRIKDIATADAKNLMMKERVFSSII